MIGYVLLGAAAALMGAYLAVRDEYAEREASRPKNVKPLPPTLPPVRMPRPFIPGEVVTFRPEVWSSQGGEWLIPVGTRMIVRRVDADLVYVDVEGFEEGDDVPKSWLIHYEDYLSPPRNVG
jgi:hypothetical protein